MAARKDDMPIQRYAAAMRFVLSALFVAFQGAEFAQAQPATDIQSAVCAAVTLLEGESVVLMPSRVERPLVAGEMLTAGSLLQTGENSRVELTFGGSSVLRLDEDSSVELGAYGRNGEKPADRFQVRLVKGGIWVTLLDQPELNPFQILAAGALFAGDKAVFRVVLFQDGSAEMKVYSGYVTASGPFVFVKEAFRFLFHSPEYDEEAAVTAPWRYRVEPYRKIIIQASGKETKPFRFTARADLSEWVRWNQQRDTGIE